LTKTVISLLPEFVTSATALLASKVVQPPIPINP